MQEKRNSESIADEFYNIREKKSVKIVTQWGQQKVKGDSCKPMVLWTNDLGKLDH